MARRKYDIGVVTYAVTERNRGGTWKDIREAIRTRFHIEPPTERIMLQWHKRYGGEQSAGIEVLVTDAAANLAKRALPVAATQTYGALIEEGFPSIIQYYKRGVDLEVAAAIVVLSMLERQFGSRVYEDAVREFQQIRVERTTEESSE